MANAAISKINMTAMIGAFALLIGCGGGDPPCEDQMNDIRSKLGEPSDITRYSSSGYTSTVWSYWSRGISYTFTESSSCDVSTFEFTPFSL